MRATALLVAAVSLGAGASCDPCKPPPETAPDYTSDSAWICRPGTTGDVCAAGLEAVEVHPDGTTTPVTHVPAVDPQVACFWVYPTMDLQLTPDVHEDLTDRETEEDVVRTQGARFTEVCSVHAPAYRQATLGVYGSTNQEVRDRCFGIAIDDVLGAFEQFLVDIGDKPFVVGGHSQGAQMTTEIVRRRVETDDALLARLVTALPIGWPVGTSSPVETIGGTFTRVPVCTNPDETGCAMAFRSFGAGNELPRDPTTNKLADVFFGESVVCTNPVEDGAPLSRAYFPVTNPAVRVPDGVADAGVAYALYRDAFTARCVRDGNNAGLEVTVAEGVTSPVDFSRNALAGDSGTHILDMQFAQGDLIDLTGRKIEAFINRR